MNQNNISIAELVGIQIDELGNDVMPVYEFVNDINDNKVIGLESISNYINDIFFAKHKGAVNQHNYNTTKKIIFNISQHTIQTKWINLKHRMLRIIGVQFAIVAIKTKRHK